MPIQLSRFRIEGLHGTRTIDIPIGDNKLILVGENGSGKTTIVNLLYYFLSCQWTRMITYRFGSLSLTINNQRFTVTSEQLQAFGPREQLGESWMRNYSQRSFLRLRDWFAHVSPDYVLGKDVSEISEEVGLPASIVSDFLHEYLYKSVPRDPEQSKLLNDVADQITASVEEQILFLPTYRRIEQDLKSIFPEMDVEKTPLHRRIARSKSNERHIELIEFGMKDVDQRIDRKMDELKEFVRSELNNLTGSYLREVISGKYKTVKVSAVKSLRPETIDSILGRIEEGILPKKEKEQLRSILQEIHVTQRIEDEQKVIAHFLLKLLRVHNAQKKKETDVNQFVDVCNKYLAGKKLSFDNNEFGISIRIAALDSKREGGGSTIRMRQLSSGEKQIVSLFSHLFLSDRQNFFVLIDEPELSLSVIWQKTFLTDVLGTGYCSGLIGVTHSPFIFENELDSFAHSIDEFSR